MAVITVYLLVLCSLSSFNIVDGLTVSVNTTVKIAEVDTTFLSVALDSDEIAKDLKQVPFSSPKFIALCEGLSKLNINRPMLYLRIGGSKGDDITFKWTGLDISSEKYVMNSTEWDEINLFAMKMQWKFIFGLNALERKRDGSWDPTNFIMLMRYTSTKGYLVNYELGNGMSVNSILFASTPRVDDHCLENLMSMELEPMGTHRLTCNSNNKVDSFSTLVLY